MIFEIESSYKMMTYLKDEEACREQEIIQYTRSKFLDEMRDNKIVL